MKEISLHILDLVENSVTAGADLIELSIAEAREDNILKIAIKDNGCGMSPAVVKTVTDPFYTTRKTRRVGLGIPMFKMNCEQCDGSFKIESTVGEGTSISGCFAYDHIDRPPLGDISATIVAIVMSLGEADLIYQHSHCGRSFTLETRQIREMLGDDVSLSELLVLNWVRDYVDHHLEEIRGVQ